MNYLITAKTDVGIARPTNQDSLSVRRYQTDAGPVLLVALCDGMGGLQKGEVASASMINTLRNWGDNRIGALAAAGMNFDTVKFEWAELIRSMNRKIRNYGRSSGISLGTTLTAGLFCGDKMFLVNVGDTRAYSISNLLIQLTKDQTFVMREVELGHMTLEQAENDKRRSVLLQCIGASEEVYPDFFTSPVMEDQVFLFCTDGFRHEISGDEIQAALQPSEMVSAETMGERLLYLIDLNKSRQERDNITAVAVRTYA